MKHILTLFGFAVVSISLAQLPNYVPSDGLVGWWGFENSLLDASSNGLDLQNQGCSFQEDRNGYETSALTCEGDASMAWTYMPPVEGAFSVSIWCKLNTLFDYGAYSWIEYGQNLIGSSGSSGWNLGIDSANLYVYYFYASQNEGGCPGIGDDISGSSATEWFHLVGVRDESSIRLYFNGTLVMTNECASSASMNYINNELRFANRDNASPGAIRSVDDAGIWNRALDEDEILALYLSEQPIPGCTDTEACNYEPTATDDDGSCLDCMLFADRCGEGTVWDNDSQTCVVANPSDTDFNGCVGMTDLLDLLSSFGTCMELPWACGDPLDYQGYDYETVQIGEQCWFAENLRSESYSNDDEISADLSDSEWGSTSSGAIAVYGEGNSNCSAHSPNGDACNEAWSLDGYGRLYNLYAVNDERGLCPSGWHVPSDGDWTDLEIELGMNEANAFDAGYRGGEAQLGNQMKATYGWHGSSGLNTTGLSCLPSGLRYVNSNFSDAGNRGVWWCASLNASTSWYRQLGNSSDGVFRDSGNPRDGLSVRCIQDSE